MRDARDVNDKVSADEGGLPQQKALTLEIVTIRERLVNSGALIRWTSKRKHENERSDEGITKSQDNTWLGYYRTEKGAYKETLRRFARNRRLNQNVHAGRNLSKLQRV